MTSVLVTGASGLIGRQVIAQLAARPGEVSHLVAMDLRDVPEEGRLPGVRYLNSDIRNPQLGKQLSEHSVDCVVHLAAIVTPGKDSTREFEYSIDVLGSENVLAACLEAGVRQLVYTSSGAAYGYHADNPVPLSEKDALRGNPEFAYSDHKRLVEEMLARAREEHPELAQLIFRPGTILGETVSNPITAMFDRPVVLGVRGSDSPFVIIWDEDVASAIVKGIREQRSGIFNLAGDGTISLPEIARRLGKPYLSVPASLLAGGLQLANSLGLTKLGPEQVRFLRYRPVLSNEALKNEFGFTPTNSSGECFDRYRAFHFAN
ncbi:MAG: SDR family oxidoreductase [bacterium]|nr:SDR family oxidoreductase [bacterium]